MEWVETTGRTVEDAKEAALDQLGIDASEAEFEILEEPKTGLFGRVRSEARVRARIVPKAPRAKQERRPRKARGTREDPKPAADKAAPAKKAPAKRAPAKKAAAPAEASADQDESSAEATAPKPRTRAKAPRREQSTGNGPVPHQEGSEMSDEVVSVDDQADMITEFLDGLLDSLGVTGEITRTKVDDETIELGVDGSDLGLLIGPKGQTLTAVHELSRTVLQRRATGRHAGRVRIDIGGYRQRRQEALSRFVQAQAEDVKELGVARALEPMNAVDRKIVHDTVNEIEGVSTVSEGTDPARRVVLVPEGAEE